MMEYKNNFDDFILSINTENGLGIWWALDLHNEKQMTTREKFLKLKEFFEYSIFHNRIIEYDLENQKAIFSGDEPGTVFDRIFADFPLDQLPEYDGDNDNRFFAYMAVKFNGWAILNEGTTLCIPD
ncbi:hypothetical protein HLH26_17235 [Gluconacetobacter sp. 1b LMG 1731]|uniref:Uncharacterized protein n=1 Tax=Gluconacetobacter dulcium TaxID=2729096 RepID=A0A7W4INS9_9PROT|nr:hypothetical protein [Gluconacetobacter dulcium]MBB2166238.1 hypothetical protein [Gluconacetobacter dulcium]MBB2195374.1 hypothetical protein [Gluconacetobacter dulcium]